MNKMKTIENRTTGREMEGMSEMHYERIRQATKDLQLEDTDIGTGSSLVEGIRYAFAARSFRYEAKPEMIINGVPHIYHLTKITQERKN